MTPEATLFSKEQIDLLQKLLRQPQPQPSPVPPVLGTRAVERKGKFFSALNVQTGKSST